MRAGTQQPRLSALTPGDLPGHFLQPGVKNLSAQPRPSIQPLLPERRVSLTGALQRGNKNPQASKNQFPSRPPVQCVRRILKRPQRPGPWGVRHRALLPAETTLLPNAASSSSPRACSSGLSGCRHAGREGLGMAKLGVPGLSSSSTSGRD